VSQLLPAPAPQRWLAVRLFGRRGLVCEESAGELQRFAFTLGEDIRGLHRECHRSLAGSIAASAASFSRASMWRIPSLSSRARFVGMSMTRAQAAMVFTS